MGTSDLDVHEIAPRGPARENLPGARVRWMRRPGPGTLVAVLWAAGAAAACAAPFATFFHYRVTVRPDGTVGTQSVGAYDIDGWGRVHAVAARAPSLVGTQPVWYAAATYLGAGLLLVATASLALRSLRWARRTGIAAGCALAAVVAAEGAAITTLSARVGGQAIEPTVAVHSQAGGSALIGAAAGLCAAAGVILSLRIAEDY